MKCPYCGGELEEGKIYSADYNHGISWFPSKSNWKYFGFFPSEQGGIVLKKWTKKLLNLRGTPVFLDVDVCRKCGVGVFRFEEEKGPSCRDEAIIDFLNRHS